VKALKTPGRYGDGRGLHLYVKDAERRVWVLRYMVRGRSRDMGLGRFPEVSLAEAREKAEAARKLLRAGTDPLDAREAEKAKLSADRDQTFRRAAEDLIAAKLSSWRSPKYRGQWSATLTTYAYPVIGDWPVRQVDTEAVLRILRPLWVRAPDTASKLRGRIEAVLDSAKASGWRDGENPARWKGHLASRLPPPRKVKPVEHRPSLPWQQVGSFMAALRAIDGIPARAVEFAILTAARAGEVRSMPWREVDMDAAVWTVPAGRMKAAKAHRVPLSPAALAILQAVRPANPRPATFVFQGTKPRRAVSEWSVLEVLNRMNEVEEGQELPWRDPIQNCAITLHGFRSTFRVWAGEETHYPREVVEAALAHTIKDRAEAAYARTDLLERRRPLMEEWARFCARQVC
jgi:integrase